MTQQKYYKAYEERYKKIHSETGKAWAGESPSPIIEKLLQKYGASSDSSVLEIGCGEGQNALNLLAKGYNIFASDVSQEAISWCKSKAKESGIDENRFFVMDILDNDLTEKYDFIYSVAVLHMLVDDDDRKKFLKFVKEHLNETGKAFVIIMGDGIETRKTDASKAFELAERSFEGGVVRVANTSCRMVTWQEFLEELEDAHLTVLDHYNDTTVSGFVNSMVAEVERGK